MENRIWQLEGEDSNLGLFIIPNEIKDIQDKFDEAFEHAEIQNISKYVSQKNDYLLNDAADYLKEKYNISRIYIHDYAFTNKL